MPIKAAKLGTCSRQDPEVSRVMHYTLNGWPASVPPQLKSFHSRRDELTIEGNCLLWGIRAVVPKEPRRCRLCANCLQRPKETEWDKTGELQGRGYAKNEDK